MLNSIFILKDTSKFIHATNGVHFSWFGLLCIVQLKRPCTYFLGASMHAFLGVELLDHTAYVSSISWWDFYGIKQCMRDAIDTNIGQNHGIFIALHSNHLDSVHILISNYVTTF